MRLCVMIEGQEGVTWEEWLALARACEEHGYDALFRSDHYGSVMADEERGSLASSTPTSTCCSSWPTKSHRNSSSAGTLKWVRFAR